jgi:hypothetical protein
MTNTNETIADIVAEMRTLSNPISDGIIAINGRSIADRLEAAHRREKAAIEADALAVGGMIEASRKRKLSKDASKNGVDFGQLGDAAKLREALIRCDAIAQLPEVRDEQSIKDMRNIIRQALSAPPRNCDKYSHDEALRIWSAEPENPMNGCFDVWLYAPATEQKGEVNGNK